MKIYSSLVAISALVAFSGCNSTQPKVGKLQTTSEPQVKSISFSEVKVPTTDIQKRRVIASKQVTINGKEHKIGYDTIMRSGDRVGEGIFGALYDYKGELIRTKDGNIRISNDNDFSSLLPVGDKLFMVSHFETRPAAMYLTELEQLESGYLVAKNTKNIDFSKFNGLWVPCAGSRTPWNTHLGSEEYEPDGAKVKADGSINDYYNLMAEYFGGDLKRLNPYDYGWTPEVKVLNEKGDVEVSKHYTMGRFAHELAYVMPDEKTVFLSDDGTNVTIFMFIADKPKDLSSGTLYAAKWNQVSKEGLGSAKIEWVSLGHATDKEIKQALDSKVKFSDMFKVASQNSGKCPTGFSHSKANGVEECLQLKSGMEKIASRLESRRVAAIKGATTEFRKMEGITYNNNDNALYIAMSQVAKGMEDGSKYDTKEANHVRLTKNKCGGVYKLYFNDNKFGSNYVPRNMSGLVAGFSDKSVPNNSCSVTSLANPDNVTYINNTNTLIIGEDTGSGHQNDYIWSYDINNDKLTRIQTTPYGSETTSPYYYNNVNGFGYIMSVVQHPYGESDKDKSTGVADNRAYTGYMGPFPVITK